MNADQRPIASALLTDLYQITMAYAYWKAGKADQRAVFHLFYRKQPFKGGFAIHGYPSVPAYPASHGCVRIPMWIAPSLFNAHGLGTTVVVHL